VLKNRGIVFKLIALVVTAGGFIFLCVFGYSYFFSRRTIEKNINESARNLAQATVGRIEASLRSVQKIPLNDRYFVESTPLDPAALHDLLFNVLESNADICGAAIAFEPGKRQNVRGFAPYVYRSDRTIEFTELASERIDYTLADWYQIPRELSRPEWSEPYYGEGQDRTLKSTYSVPFYMTAKGQKRLAGVIAVDISLKRLQAIVSSVKVLQTGYAFLISQNGTVVTHPRSELIMNATIFGMAEEAGDTSLRELGRRMIKGESGLVPLGPGPLGPVSLMYYAPIPSNNWSLAVVFPVAELMADVRRFNMIASILAVAGLAALSGAVVIIAHSITRPLRTMAQAAGHIAEGDFDAPLPVSRSGDEVGVLTKAFEDMRISLKDYIERLTETTAAKQAIESELKVAREIQMSIIPKTFPSFPAGTGVDMHAWIEPARDVGGDFYDFFFLDRSRLCAVIADVSDKGVPASLFMAVTKTLIKAKAAPGKAPGDVLTTVNNELATGSGTNMFVTVFFAVLDIETGELLYANGGHNPPILIRSQGKAAPIERTGNPVVGVIEGIEYGSKGLTLYPGDMLLLFTDGVTEAVNLRGELFGDERLLEEVSTAADPSPSGRIEAVRQALARYSEGVPQADDITILAVRYEGPLMEREG
jgi:sigma-B regulation protein RsbU (phosphoserine phosphatase)